MQRWNPRSPWLVGTMLLTTLALGAAACSASDMGGGDSADTTAMHQANITTTTAAGGGDSGSPSPALAGPDDVVRFGSDGIEPIVFQPTDFGRDIIFTADLTVAVTDVAVAGDRATREIAGLGGILFGQRTTGAPNPVSVLTFKVEPADFAEALDRLSSIGDVRSQNVSASDVTERIVDLESRILSAEASVERLRELLASAGGVAVVVQVETELLQRETQLETLRGQLRTLEDQVSLATIVMTITEAVTRPGVEVIVTAYAGHDGSGSSCPGDSGLTVDAGDPVTVCFEIVNTGDTPVTDLEVADPVLDVELGDLTVVLGNLDAPLEPGGSVVLATELAADEDLRTRTRVSATPLDADGRVLVGRSVANTSSILINAVDPGGVPGFSEGLAASLGFLANLGRVLILGAGVLLPFVWLLPIIALMWLRWRRQAPGTSSGTDEELAPAG